MYSTLVDSFEKQIIVVMTGHHGGVLVRSVDLLEPKMMRVNISLENRVYILFALCLFNVFWDDVALRWFISLERCGQRAFAIKPSQAQASQAMLKLDRA
ncbi:hypothetical protein Tco_1080530 [Tanacetum coccineum]|uniref:Uncharacterized protein n=1 Tax=Tanacetum coccineum TaxID=301880 RepID=A0ABQ5HVG0_9ASTR